MKSSEVVLGERCFTLDDQVRFSQFSGDRNPIHIDQIQARKTHAGECVVHGIHVFLWALQLLISRTSKIPNYLKIKFHGQIELDKRIRCLWSEKSKCLNIIGSHDEVMISIMCEGMVDSDLSSEGLPLRNQKKLKYPNDTKSKYSVGSVCFESIYGGEVSLAEELFPQLSKRVGLYLVYEIAVLSNIVGMQIPGSRSIFISCVIKFRRENIAPFYKIMGFDGRFGKVDLEYSGRNLDAVMGTFIRPKGAPVQSCINIQKKLDSSAILKGRKVLILGGSRGIGAWVAKIIGCLGGDVTISYVVGEDEASAVCCDINNNTPSDSKAQKFDITKDNFEDCFKEKFEDLFYFPTPKIFGKKSSVFEQERYDLFHQFYCLSFEKISKSFSRNGGSNIFYPSTVAVEQNIKELEEYKKAKEIGEKICTQIEQSLSIRVLVERLDRVHTDQTLNILNSPALDPFDVSVGIVNKMYNFSIAID